MKKLLNYFVVALALSVALTGCDKENKEKSLKVDPDKFDFVAAGNDDVVSTVTAVNVEWEAKVEDAAKDWLSIAVKGNEITVKVTDNDTEDERDGKVVVSDKKGEVQSVSITVKQAAGDAIERKLEVDKATLEFDAVDSGSQTLTVTALNVEWEAKVEDAAKDWLSVTVAGDVITVTAKDNMTVEDKTGKITVSDKGGKVANAVVDVTLKKLVPDQLFTVAIGTYYGAGSYRVELGNGDAYINQALKMLNVANGYYMQLANLTAPAPEDEWNIVVPSGTYVFEDTNEEFTVTPGSFMSEWGFWSGSTMREKENDDTKVTNGLLEGSMEVAVTGGIHRIAGKVLLDDDRVITFYYEGEISIQDEEEKDYGSTLRGDLDIEPLTGGAIGDMGDSYGYGLRTWVIFAWNGTVYLRDDGAIMGDGDVLQLEFYSEMSATELPVGTYELSDEQMAGTAYKGQVGGWGYKGCWYRKLDGWDTPAKAPAVSGTVKVERNGDAYILTLDAKDDHPKGPFDLKVSYNGNLEVYQ